MEKKMTLEEFAALINAADEWKLEFNEIIAANDWTAMQDEWKVCNDGKKMIYLDDDCVARIKTIE